MTVPACAYRGVLAALLLSTSLSMTGGRTAAGEQDVALLRKELDDARASYERSARTMEAQGRLLQELQRRLEALDAKTLGTMVGRGTGSGQSGPSAGATTPVVLESSSGRQTGAVEPPPRGVERVGEAPQENKPPQIAVLRDQGGIITRRGRWTVEPSFEYAHADRNRVLFRGIELVESVLVGMFDINETREDVLTAALGVRYGITDRFEASVRVPYIYRADRTVLSPIAGSNNPGGSVMGVQDFAAKGNGIGDVEASLRYQITGGQNGWPFLIFNLQAVAPTGTNPFGVKRDISGAPTEAATGSGFWGLSPSITAILPTDPAVLFASFGYTRNFGRAENARIGSAQVDYVKPGDAPSISVGIGVSLNDRTAFNLGYAHTWAFGTSTRTRLEQSAGPLQPITLSAPIENTSRDIQVGRYLFGVSYRLNEKTTMNWSVEIGATAEAPNVHTTLRVPFSF